MTQTVHGVLLDIDGTLVNSNDAQAHAWLDAMHDYGYAASFEKVRPLIGMGGDKVLPEVLGVDKNSDQGQKISQRRKEISSSRYLPQVHAFPHAQDLLQRMHEQGLKLVVATSAEPDELQKSLQIIGPQAGDLVEQAVTSQDASQSKPDSDIITAALQRAQCAAEEVVMLGDTPYDIEAAAKDGVRTIAFRCGGWQDEDLAQAIAIYDDPADLLAHYDESPLAKEN